MTNLASSLTNHCWPKQWLRGDFLELFFLWLKEYFNPIKDAEIFFPHLHILKAITYFFYFFISVSTSFRVVFFNGTIWGTNKGLNNINLFLGESKNPPAILPLCFRFCVYGVDCSINCNPPTLLLSYSSLHQLLDTLHIRRHSPHLLLPQSPSGERYHYSTITLFICDPPHCCLHYATLHSAPILSSRSAHFDPFSTITLFFVTRVPFFFYNTALYTILPYTSLPSLILLFYPHLLYFHLIPTAHTFCPQSSPHPWPFIYLWPSILIPISLSLFYLYPLTLVSF